MRQTDDFIDAPDARLFCVTLGAGTPMVTLHGSGFDSNMLRPWLDSLAESVKLTYVDVRACGRSVGARLLEGVRYSATALNRTMFGEVQQFDVVARLGEIAVPTLVIGGDDDPLAPVSRALEPLARGIPNATREVIDGAGHFPYAEQPQAFTEAVRRWLATLSVSTD